MSCRTSMIASVLFALIAAVPLGAQTDADIELGHKFLGSFSFAEDQDLLGFTGVAGQLLTVRAKGSKGVLPVVALFDGAGTFIDTTAFEKGLGGKSFSIRKYPLPASGDYLLAITASTGAIGK